MRIANFTISDAIIRQIQSLSTQQTKLQAQVSSGQRISQPSDDPAAMGRVLNLQSDQDALAQYTNNSSRALEISQAATSGIQSIKKISDRASELATLGSSATNATSMPAYSTEVNQLIEQAIQLGNSKYGNDYLYAGTAVNASPLTVARDAQGNVTGVTYAGNSNQAQIPLSTTATIAPGATGATNQNIVDFINHLVSLRDNLNTQNTAGVTTDSNNLMTTEDGFVSAIAEQGAVQMRIQVNQSQQADLDTNLKQLVSTEVDADMPSTIVKLNQASTAYQAALQSASSIMRMSLLDYLK